MIFSKILRCSLCLLALTSSILVSNSHAAAITFNTALPISQHQRIARGLVSYEKSSSKQSSLERDSLSLASVFAYGINSKLAVFGVLPTGSIRLRSTDQQSDQSAFGDAQLFGRYEVWRSDNSGATKRIAPFFGVRLATGENGVNSDGTTDTFGGVVFTSASTKQNFDVQLKFDLNGSNNGLDAGNAFSIDTSWQRRIAPINISAETRGFWFAALETNIQYTEKSSLLGEPNINSGGFIASIAPGMQYVTRRWITELAIRIPIVSNLNGESLEPDFTIFTGIRTNF